MVTQAFYSPVAVEQRSLLFTFLHSVVKSGTIFEITAACTEEHLGAEALAQSVKLFTLKLKDQQDNT